jgi:hypothetical protein
MQQLSRHPTVELHHHCRTRFGQSDLLKRRQTRRRELGEGELIVFFLFIDISQSDGEIGTVA